MASAARNVKSTSPRVMNAREVARANKWAKGSGFDEIQSAMAYGMMAKINGPVTPFIGAPVTPQGMAKADRLSFRADYNQMVTDVTDDSDGEWLDWWDQDESGYGYNNKAASKGSREVTRGKMDPALISVMPTSTINHSRPRTVAAGYSDEREVLTVVFRDGTMYNYYDVPATVWGRFKRTPSKGRFILQVLDAYPRGAAAIAGGQTMNREQLYRAARSSQILSGPSKVRSINPLTGVREQHDGVSTKMQQDYSRRPS